MTARLEHSRALASSGAWAELCRDLATLDGDEPPELHTLHAEALLRTGQPRASCAVMTQAVPMIVAKGSSALLRRATNLLGAAYFELGELQDAEALFSEALAHAQADGDQLFIARASNNLALIANIRGEHILALAQFQRAIAAYQRAGNALGLAECHHNVAIAYRDLGHLAMASEHEERAVGFARSSGQVHLMAAAQAGRAELLLRSGDASLAEATARRAAADLAACSDPSRRADALRVAGLATATRDPGSGCALLDEAVHEARRCGATLVEAECLRARSDVHAQRGGVSDALADARAAHALFRALGAERESHGMAAGIARLEATMPATPRVPSA